VSDGDLQVTILGHASLLFDGAGEQVLLDPVLRTTRLIASQVHQYPRTLDFDRLPRPTAIVFTHAHFDHFDGETRADLPKDVPVVVPPDRRMLRALEKEGFGDVRPLEAWGCIRLGDLGLIATPSGAPVTEFGLVVESPAGRFWHMSDAEPLSDTAARIVGELGPVDAVSAKFQPADPQLNFQHNMGSSFNRRLVASWLETACACAPRLVFPYASGLCFEGERAWLNRYAYPFSAEFVAGLLDERLGDAGSATTVRPGDIVTISDRGACLVPQASGFVRQVAPGTTVDWAPFDDRRLIGLATTAERRQFDEDLTAMLLGSEFAEWLARQSCREGGMLEAFRDWRTRCQASVHLGAGERWDIEIDFGADEPTVRRGKSSAADYFTHIGGDAARRLLAGVATPLEVMLEGSAFIHERIVKVRDGRFDAPSTTRIYEEFPDPLVSFGATRKAKR